jgi:hypothetical protein
MGTPDRGSRPTAIVLLYSWSMAPIPLHGLVCVALGFLLGAVSGLALLIGLVLTIAGRRGSGVRRFGAALTAGSLLPAAVAVAMVFIPDALANPELKRQSDAAALVAAPAAAAAGVLVSVLVVARGRRRQGRGDGHREGRPAPSSP